MDTIFWMLAQADDELLDLPEDGAAWIVWVIVLAIIGGLYVLVTRTRRRAEEEFWERKRRERDERK